jgi:DNA replication and repair protein RecF
MILLVRKFFLENFRNYESLEAKFSPEINIIYGNNGQGKTNLLEGIFLCSIGRSYRTSKDGELIKRGCENFKVKLELSNDITDNVQVEFKKNKEKVIKVNDLCLHKIGQLVGSFLTVLFTPEDMMLVNEGPGQRRRFMDIAISQQKPTYFYFF